MDVHPTLRVERVSEAERLHVEVLAGDLARRVEDLLHQAGFPEIGCTGGARCIEQGTQLRGFVRGARSGLVNACVWKAENGAPSAESVAWRLSRSLMPS